ncbi:MAG: hypothetical protein ACE5DM_00570 [Candidatus Nanoarchaeia archaeon]
MNKAYAYLAYKENNVQSGRWIIRIKGNSTAGTSFDPAQMEKQSQKAEGKEFFIWRFNMQPKEDDPRLVETRVFQSGGKPSHAELHLILRNADDSAKDEKVGRFDWPA